MTVALVEVQLRYFVDDRITVRSLDGRTDPLLLTFVHPTFVDHAGYLKARRVNYLLDLPNYNRDASAWSLAALRSLAPGDVAGHDGLTFRRVRNGGVIEVIPDINTVSADSPPARRLLCCRRVVLGAAQGTRTRQGANDGVPPPARSSGPGARE